MNKEISNQKQPITPNEHDFNDRDILQDSLDSLKHLGTLVGTLVTEASNKKLFSTVEEVEKKVKKSSRQAFNTMFQLGWYSMTEDTEECIQKTYQQFLQYKEEQLD